MSRVVVFGSMNEDLVLRVSRTPRPGETLLGSGATRLSGGKGANQAVAAARLGASVAMAGAVGQDDAGARQLQNLIDNGVDVSGVTREPAETGLAVVTVTDAGKNSIVVVAGANEHVSHRHAQALASDLRDDDIFVAQLELPADVVAAALAVAKSCGARTLLNAAPMTNLTELMGAVDMLVVNETEADLLCRQRGLHPADSSTTAAELARLLDVGVVMTLGSDGAVLVRENQIWQVPGLAIDVVDTTGAGDTFVGALAAALAGGLAAPRALELANCAAALACTAVGAQSAMPTMDLQAVQRS
jgi:ribokinase